VTDRAVGAVGFSPSVWQQLSTLVEAFLTESIDLTSYRRQRDKGREELTFAKIDRSITTQPRRNRLS
jgi:hypothetical protein